MLQLSCRGAAGKEIWRRRRDCVFCRGGGSRVSLLFLLVVVVGKGEEGDGCKKFYSLIA